jgi:hypothetical protein
MQGKAEGYPINNRHYPILASNQGRTEDLSLTCDFLPNLKTFHHLSNFPEDGETRLHRDALKTTHVLGMQHIKKPSMHIQYHVQN